MDTIILGICSKKPDNSDLLMKFKAFIWTFSLYFLELFEAFNVTLPFI